MFAIAVILGITGLIWGALFAIRGSLVAGCLVYMLLCCCLGSYFYSFDIGSITVTLDRLFLVGLVGAYCVQWRMGRTQPKPLERVDYFVFGLIGLLGTSTIFQDQAELLPGDVPMLQHLINGYLIPITLYWIARQSRLTEANMTMVLGALTLFGVYLAFTGICESMGWFGAVFPRYISDPELGIHFGRARGPMLHSVSYGIYLDACLLAAWLLRPRLPRHWQLAVLAVMPMFLAAIYLSKTRSVWVGAATGVMLLILLTMRGRARVFAVASIMLAGLAVGVAKMDAIMGLQREGTVQDTRKSASMRGSFAYVSWKMFQDKPIFGFGFGQFATAKLPYLADRSTDLDLESIREYVHHNTFLSILIELGAVGLLVFLAVYIGWNWSAWQLIKSKRAPPWARQIAILLVGLMGIIFWQMVGHEITFTPIDQSILYFVAGCTVGLRSLFAPAKQRQKRGATARRELRLGGQELSHT